MDDLAKVNSSYQRMSRNSFGKSFYERLLQEPAIRIKFKDTNFERQIELLWHGIWSLLQFASGKTMGKIALERLQTSHNESGYGVTREMYDIWVETLVTTAAEQDPKWEEDLADAWRMALRPGIKVMLTVPPVHV